LQRDKFGKKSFNIDVEERKQCFQALFDNDMAYQPENESTQTIVIAFFILVLLKMCQMIRVGVFPSVRIFRPSSVTRQGFSRLARSALRPPGKK
jgi:hypothetical protein